MVTYGINMTTTLDNQLQAATIGGMGKVMSLRLPDDVAKALEKYAAFDFRSQSQVVVMAIRHFLSMNSGRTLEMMKSGEVGTLAGVQIDEESEAASSGVPAGGEMPHGARTVRTKSRAGVSGRGAGDEKGDGPSFTTTGIPVSGNRPKWEGTLVPRSDVGVLENMEREAGKPKIKPCAHGNDPRTCQRTKCKILRNES